MYGTARLAGYFAAHGVWCVSEGTTLIPLLGFENADGERGIERFVDGDATEGDATEGAQVGRAALHANQWGAARAAFVADAMLDFGQGSIDALIVDAVHYGTGRSMTMAVPYRPQPSELGFAVYRPKLIDAAGVDEDEYDALAEAFFDGVEAHEPAAAVWNAHLDASV